MFVLVVNSAPTCFLLFLSAIYTGKYSSSVLRSECTWTITSLVSFWASNPLLFCRHSLIHTVLETGRVLCYQNTKFECHPSKCATECHPSKCATECHPSKCATECHPSEVRHRVSSVRSAPPSRLWMCHFNCFFQASVICNACVMNLLFIFF